jgi:hypothetical protein
MCSALLVEADHMVGAREHHALHTVAARGFVDVEDALDVGFEDFLERPLDRHAAQVHDRVATFQQRMHRGLVREVARNDFLVRIGGRSQRCDIGEAQHVCIRLQPLAQHLAQAAGRAGQQQPVEFLVRSFHRHSSIHSLVMRSGRSRPWYFL